MRGRESTARIVGYLGSALASRPTLIKPKTPDEQPRPPAIILVVVHDCNDDDQC